MASTASSEVVTAGQSLPGVRAVPGVIALVSWPLLVWLGNPAFALLAGAGSALAAGRRPIPAGNRWAACSLQAAIVLLGLKLDLATVWSLSAAYTGAIAVYVVATLALGMLLARWLVVDLPSARLVSAGTAICGGTAIATLSGLVRAQPQQTGVALAIVLLLNVVALLTFPFIGRALELSQLQFGVWAALSIHDTSSVVATAALYGERAAEVATTLKLGRTLWLIPLIFLLGMMDGRARRLGGEAQSRLRIPMFILGFLAAAGLGSAVELPETITATAGALSGWLLVTALFLVGMDLTRATVRRIRGRVIWQAVALWLVAAPATLAAVIWLVPAG